jgi:hypothetical protein
MNNPMRMSRRRVTPEATKPATSATRLFQPVVTADQIGEGVVFATPFSLMVMEAVA